MKTSRTFRKEKIQTERSTMNLSIDTSIQDSISTSVFNPVDDQPVQTERAILGLEGSIFPTLKPGSLTSRWIVVEGKLTCRWFVAGNRSNRL